MADLKSKQIKFPLTETNVVSSSAQIATDISGSFVDASGSFSTRVTTAESELGNTLISGSAQIATDISGSFTGELSGSHIKFVGGGVSGSAASTASFGELEIGNGGDIVLTEDQRIYFEADKATYIESHAADSFRVVVNDKQMFLLDEDTGDRAVFGNGTKVFIGANNNFTPLASLHIAGNIWVSGSDAQGGAHVTASGNISSSATITSENSIVKNDLTVGGNLDIADTIFHTGDSNTKIRFPDVDTISFHTSGEERLRISTGGHITASGDISSSATITANEFNGIFNGALSGSAQIATDVSGSFVAPSASFSTRITTAESELGNTILSSSAQISDDISGSLSAAAVVGLGAGIISGSSSNSSLTTAIVGEGANIVSASAQLSTDISGSFVAPSASISTRLTTTENVVSSSVISGSAQIDHDSTTNFVANEHIDHSSVSVIAGTGMTGGGTIAANRTLNVIGGTGVTANANDIAIGQDVATTANVQFNHISASGNISSSRGSFLGFDSGSFNINLGVGTTTPAESLEVVGAISASTSGSFLNIDAPHIKATSVHGTILTATQGTIDHDSLANFVGNEHVDHSGVTITAGDGLTGGGTIASTRTLAVGEGTGVTVNANDVAIGQDVATNANVNFASVTTTGNIVAQGDITAQNYIVSSSVTHMTSSIRSGSTVSGDTPADDTHQFTGSLSISGSSTDITNTMTASLASIFLQNNGHISSSLGTIKGFSAINGTTITGTTFTGVSGSFSENLGVNTTTPAEALEVVGSVSASASGSFLNVDVTDNLGVTGIFTLPNIANVSASIASAVAGGDDLGNHTATQDLDMDGNDIFDVQHISGSGNISGSLGNILGYKSGSFQQLDAIVVSASSVQATNLLGLVGTATQGTIDHDSLANFVANEHVDHTSITLTAGDGLSGGGTIASNRSFAVDATVLRTTGDSVISSSAQLADDISGSFSTAAVVGLGAGIISGSSSNSSLTTAIVGEGAGILSGSAQIADDVSGSLSAAAIVGLGAGVISASAMVDHDSATNFVANEHINHTSVSITAGDGLTGGGTIAANRTINVVGGDGITANANDIAITAAQTTIESIYKSDLVIGEDDETQIDFETANEIHFDVDNSELLNLAGTKISGSQASTGSFGVLETAGGVTVTTTGRVGVGTADPDFKLDVAGNAGFNEYIRHNGDNDTHIRFQANQVDISAGGNIYSYDGAAFNLTGHLSASGNISGSQIEASGDIIAFGSSDRNLKDNIQPIENPLEKMDKIGGYTFVWNNKQSTYQGKDVGVVAQEIQEVLPEIVSGRANGYLGVKYEKIVPLLIESIKELKKEVEDIKQKCDCLTK